MNTTKQADHWFWYDNGKGWTHSATMRYWQFYSDMIAEWKANLTAAKAVASETQGQQ